jgi:hypothetical protein
LNNRGIIGIVLIALGILVLIFPEFLRVIVAIALILGGLWLALQNSPARTNI